MIEATEEKKKINSSYDKSIDKKYNDLVTRDNRQVPSRLTNEIPGIDSWRD